MQYTKATEVPNAFDTEGTPLISLGFMSGKVEKAEKFGLAKARLFVEKAPELRVMCDNWPKEKGFFEHVLKLYEGTNNEKDVKITANRLSIIEHYMDDIKAYIDKYYVPFVREAIEAPCIIQVEKDMDIENVLCIPCYPMSPGDTGSGLIPIKFAQRDAKYLFDEQSCGITIKDVKEHFKQKRTDNLVVNMVTKDGRSIDLTYTPEKVAAIMKYKNIIMNFALNPNEIEEE